MYKNVNFNVFKAVRKWNSFVSTRLRCRHPIKQEVDVQNLMQTAEINTQDYAFNAILQAFYWKIRRNFFDCTVHKVEIVALLCPSDENSIF